MAAEYSICLGTAGWGVWHSPDAGRSWIRHRAPFPLNSRIQALAVHPNQTQTLFAGGDTGVFVSRDGGARWERLAANGDLPTVWSMAIDPVDPDILFAGTRPAGVYRSRDGGRQWQKLAVDIASECSIGVPFVTSIVVDPDDHLTVWAGVEIDGVFRSRDGGDTWTRLKTGLFDPDIHAVAVAATQPKRLYASTAREVFLSDNLGDTWQALGIREKWPLPYARGMAVKTDDPGVLFAGCGETTTGETGYVLRSANFGESWQVLTETRPAECHGMGPRHPSRRRRPHCGVHAVRRGVRHRGRRRVVAQDRARIRRDQGRGLGTALIFRGNITV